MIETAMDAPEEINNGEIEMSRKQELQEMADKEKGPPPKPDPLVAAVGDVKCWQFLIVCWIFISKVGTGSHTLAIMFLTPKTDFNCSDPGPEVDKCSSDCNARTFDRSQFEETITTEWDLTCERASLGSLSQSIVMFGIMVGSIAFGIWSDKYGRKPAFLGCCFMQLITGPIVSLSPWFWFHCVFRFLVAFATGGTMMTSFVLLMEIIGPKWRELISITYQIPFNLGHASVAVWAYFFRHWRTYYLGLSLVSLIYIPYIWVIPETPRWLLAKGKFEKAVDILEKAAARNKMPTENIKANVEEVYKAKLAAADVKKGTMADLFKYPNLRMKTIIMAFDWLVVCLAYYGNSQYISNLGGNIFINVFISALSAIPGTLVCVPMTKYMGRKATFIVSNFISGISLCLIAAIPDIGHTPQIILAIIGLFGSSITFPNAYLYAGELFPTVVRNSGIGFCSLIGRIGSIIAPFIAQIGDIHEWLPPLIIGVFSLVAAASIFFLPETKGHPIPDTIEEGESFGKKEKKNTE